MRRSLSRPFSSRGTGEPERRRTSPLRKKVRSHCGPVSPSPRRSLSARGSDVSRSAVTTWGSTPRRPRSLPFGTGRVSLRLEGVVRHSSDDSGVPLVIAQFGRVTVRTGTEPILAARPISERVRAQAASPCHRSELPLPPLRTRSGEWRPRGRSRPPQGRGRAPRTSPREIQLAPVPHRRGRNRVAGRRAGHPPRASDVASP